MMIIFHFIFKVLKNPNLKVELNGFLKKSFYLHKMFDFTK